MLRAVWNGRVLAAAARTVVVDGNHYFPLDSLRREYVVESPTRSLCPWKGVARYYTITVDGRTAPDAAWYYPHPSPFFRRIKDHVAFGDEIAVEDVVAGGEGAGRRT